MQNMYVLVSGEYSEDQLMWGVFSSEEKANQVANQIMKRYDSFRPSDFSILEMPLDEMVKPF